MIACLHITYANGRHEFVRIDSNWQTVQSNILISGIFEGETVDTRIEPASFTPAEVFEHSKEILVPQQGCGVVEQEIVYPC